MKPVGERLGRGVERFLDQVQRIDGLRAELEELEHFEVAAVPRLLESIETSRGAIRDAHRTLREMRGERRRRERQLIRLRRGCGLEQTAGPAGSRLGREPQPEAGLATGRELLRRLAEWPEAVARSSRGTHVRLHSSRLTVQRCYELLQQTRAFQGAHDATQPAASSPPLLN